MTKHSPRRIAEQSREAYTFSSPVSIYSKLVIWNYRFCDAKFLSRRLLQSPLLLESGESPGLESQRKECVFIATFMEGVIYAKETARRVKIR